MFGAVARGAATGSSDLDLLVAWEPGAGACSITRHPRHLPRVHQQNLQPLRFQNLSWTTEAGRSHRAMARRRNDAVYWFWVGMHEAYNGLLARWR